MPVEMTDIVYSSLCDIVGDKLRKPVFESREIGSVVSKQVWTKVSKGIYIILDSLGFVAYVGSVDRNSDSGLSQRILEHTRIPNRHNWHRVMILPLLDGVPEIDVRCLEGAIGRRLRPYDNDKLPNCSKAGVY